MVTFIISKNVSTIHWIGEILKLFGHIIVLYLPWLRSEATLAASPHPVSVIYKVNDSDMCISIHSLENISLGPLGPRHLTKALKLMTSLQKLK